MQSCLDVSIKNYGTGGAGGGGGGAGGTASAPFFTPFEAFAFGLAGLPANHPIDVVCFGFRGFFFLPKRTLVMTLERVLTDVGDAKADE